MEDAEDRKATSMNTVWTCQLSMVLCTELAEVLKYGRGIRQQGYFDEYSVDLSAEHVFMYRIGGSPEVWKMQKTGRLRR